MGYSSGAGGASGGLSLSVAAGRVSTSMTPLTNNKAKETLVLPNGGTVTASERSAYTPAVSGSVVASGGVSGASGAVFPIKSSPEGGGIPLSGTQNPAATTPASSYDLTEYLRRQKAAEVESALAGLKGAYEKSMQGYDAQLETIPTQYDAARNKAAAQSAIAQMNFDERAAASGLSSGAAGQAALSRSAALQAALAGADVSQQEAMNDINLKRANLTADYETALAQARANGDAELASALYKELIRLQDLERADEQTAYNRGQDALDRQLAAEKLRYSMAQDQYEKDLTSAKILATGGDFSGYADLFGWDGPSTQRMVDYYAAQLGVSQQEAALKLAESMGKIGDLSGYEALGYDTSYQEQKQALELQKTAAQIQKALSGGTTGKKTASNSATVSASSAAKMFDAADVWGEQFNQDPEIYVKNNYAAFGYKNATAAVNAYNQHVAEQSAKPGGTITSVSQLGANALNIANQMSRITSPSQKAYFAELIEAAVNGTKIPGTNVTPPRITEAEGLFLARAMGY